MGKKQTENGSGRSSMVLFETYAIATVNPEEIRDAVSENLDGDAIGISDLERVHIPAGGGVFWELIDPDSGEPQNEKTIEGVVVAMKNTRGYWATRGTGNPPDCRCDNYRYGEHNIGSGKPGGDCDKCQFAQFGSAVDDKGNAGKGQACKMMKNFFILRKNDILPLLLVAPPTSLRPAKRYLTTLSAQRKSVKAIITSFGLEKVTGAVNPYSRITLRKVAELAFEEAAIIKTYAEQMAATFKSVTVAAGDYDQPSEDADFNPDEIENAPAGRL